LKTLLGPTILISSNTLYHLRQEPPGKRCRRKRCRSTKSTGDVRICPLLDYTPCRSTVGGYSTCNSYIFYSVELKIKYGEALSDEDEDDTVFSGDEDDEKKVKEPKEAKFKTQTSMTTVTVIEDMDQDDGTFGMPKNNTDAMEKGNKKANGNNGEEDEDDEEEGEDSKDKKKQKIGSSSATSAKGAKKLWPAKEKKKKFRKSHSFVIRFLSLDSTKCSKPFSDQTIFLHSTRLRRKGSAQDHGNSRQTARKQAARWT